MSEPLRFRILQLLRDLMVENGGLPRLEHIAERLKVPNEEVSDQLDILDDMGAIKANRLMGGSAAPVIQTHGRAIVAALSPISQELQQAILRILRERDRGRLASPSRPELAAELGTDEATVDDQLYALEDQQAITATRTFGGGVHPRITGRGKALLEELSAAESHQRHSSPAIPTPGTAFEWDIFICHASEDKEPFVRDLAKALAKHYRVWYDEFSLTVGDSLRRAIDRGLARSKYGVVVLSPRFFNKEWPQKELDGLVTLENDRKVILPVWLDIDRQGVSSFSPLLSDRLAVHAERGGR